MKHVGIITEYNPFHNGHSYQLQKVRELYPEKKIIILMSGNYVQRGEPAIFSKYLRTKCALANNADIIFELPLYYATASAEHFASASILAFQKLGIIDTLCFGAETDNIDLLKIIAQLFIDEPVEYTIHLQNELKKGISFPKARCTAASNYLENEEVAEILKQPNNILAIEYIKAILRYQANIKPIIIKRIGNGYHDTDSNSSYSSATAIRGDIKENGFNFQQAIPKECLNILEQSDYYKPLYISDFYPNLQYALWREYNHYENYFDVSENFANQLRAINFFPSTYEQLLDTLSSKQYTTTRIQRILLNILLGITKQDMQEQKDNNYIHYIRLLGLRKDASYILKDMKDCCEIPIINKVSAANTQLNDKALSYFQREVQYNHLYAQLFFNKYAIAIPSEYEHSVIILE